MPKIFINYRRGGTAGHAGRLFDRLQQDFGSTSVFMDVTAIGPGHDFRHAIQSAVIACDVLMVVIGRDWANCMDDQGRRRLEQPDDFVRLEVAAALQRGVRVIPVLVDRAELPTAGELPDDLKPLLWRQALELRDARWDADVRALSLAISGGPAPSMPAPSRASTRLLVGACAAVALLGTVGVAAWSLRSDAPDRRIAYVPEQHAGSTPTGSREKPADPTRVPAVPPAAAPPQPSTAGTWGAPPEEPSRAARDPDTNGAPIVARTRTGHEPTVVVTPPPPRAGRAATESQGGAVVAPAAASGGIVAAPPAAGSGRAASGPATGDRRVIVTPPPGDSRVVVSPSAPSSAAPCGAVGPWTPLPAPSRSWASSVFRRDGHYDRRVALLRTGPPCRSLASARRAFDAHLLTSEQYDDTVWVLKQRHAHRLSVVQAALSAGAMSRADYDAQVRAIGAEFQGR